MWRVISARRFVCFSFLNRHRERTQHNGTKASGHHSHPYNIVYSFSSFSIIKYTLSCLLLLVLSSHNFHSSVTDLYTNIRIHDEQCLLHETVLHFYSLQSIFSFLFNYIHRLYFSSVNLMLIFLYIWLYFLRAIFSKNCINLHTIFVKIILSEALSTCLP